MTDESPADSAADPGARKRTTVELDDFWLERAVDATLRANSMPTPRLKSEVEQIVLQFLKLAGRDAAPVRLLRKRQAKQRPDGHP